LFAERLFGGYLPAVDDLTPVVDSVATVIFMLYYALQPRNAVLEYGNGVVGLEWNVGQFVSFLAAANCEIQCQIGLVGTQKMEPKPPAFVNERSSVVIDRNADHNDRV
jgi:hypothetical protein